VQLVDLRRPDGVVVELAVQVALHVVGEGEPGGGARCEQQGEDHVGEEDEDQQRHGDAPAASADAPLIVPAGDDADGGQRELQQRVGAPDDGDGQDVPVGVDVPEGVPLRRVAVDVELVGGDERERGGEEAEAEEPEDQDGRRQQDSPGRHC